MRNQANQKKTNFEKKCKTNMEEGWRKGTKEEVYKNQEEIIDTIKKFIDMVF